MTKISIGDEVRVYYHPPGPATSFAEGVVSRVDVSTLRGRAFVIDVTYEVVMDREQAVKPGYRNLILYERVDDFPGRVEILYQIQADPKHEQDVEAATISSAAPEPDPFQVEIEREKRLKPTGIVASLFDRRR